MSLSSDDDDRHSETRLMLGGKKYKVLPKRWAILFIVSIILLLDTFSASYFGFINDISSIYFNMPPSIIDLLSTVNMIARSLFGIVIAICGSQLDFRTLSLMTCSTIVAGDVLIVCGILSRNSFAITVMGQIMNGFGATMALTVSQMAPSNWFPAGERGRAVSIPWILRRISPVMSNIVATQTNHLEQSLSGKNITLQEKEIEEHRVMVDFRSSTSIAYLSLACVALLTYLFSYKYLTNYPPLESGEQPHVAKTTSWNLMEELRGIVQLFSNKQFVLLFSMNILVLSVRAMTEWLLSSIVLAGFPELSDSIVGIMFCVGYSLGALGPPSAGIVLDKFKKPKITFLIGVSMVSLLCGLFSVFIHIHGFAFLFTTYIGITFFRDFTFVCVSHSFVEIMLPENNSTKVRAFSISGSVPWFSLAIYTVMFRTVLEKIGPAVAVLIPIPFNILAAVLYVAFYKPPQLQVLS